MSELVNNRIQIFDYKGNHLRFIGHQNNQLKHPYHLCIDEMDNIYVGSGENNFPLKIFDENGKLFKSLKLNENGCPIGVNINLIDGSLMVADWKNSVVYMY